MKKDTQSINGILLVNKPQGLTSNALLQQVKRLYNAAKAGHTGSLDPLATGMLPICLGEATKFCQYLLDADKCYQATALLGIRTTTGDAQGDVTSVSDEFKLSQHELETVMNRYRGVIHQVPSMFSALKHQGVPLYRYAREGVEIQRSARELTIHQLDLEHFNEQEFSIHVLCSKGTYIRSLVEDIGNDLNVGAHIIKLHRLYTAGFATEPMYTMEELHEKTPAELITCLLPMERAVMQFAVMILNHQDIIALRQGKVLLNQAFQTQSIVRLHDEQGNFLGLGEIQSPGVLKVKRLLGLHCQQTLTTTSS